MDNVPVYDKIPDNERVHKIISNFEGAYGKKPQFLARAPGRVNLIGEHIDYCGYAVLPMAIEQDILMAVSLNSESRVIRLANTDSHYQPVELDSSNYEIDKTNPKWFHYFLCGYRGIIELCSGQRVGKSEKILFGSEGDPSRVVDVDKLPKGLDIVVDGTVPHSSGLSSSSAFVCCAALSTIQATERIKAVSKTDLAEVCQYCEHYIGTEGGGMDQSISFLARNGTAKLIEFNPIRATDVVLPDGAVFVISNCCVESNKAATDHYNVRVAECRLAAQILAHKVGLPGNDVKRLCDVPTLKNISLEDVVKLVKTTFHTEPYTKDEICTILNISLEKLDAEWLSERSRKVEEFKLLQRALHVYSEADRVLKFKLVCDERGAGCMQELGTLMYESHVSCRDMYECSCTQLDLLVELAMSSGALGSRLTGAGWGGCAVSLVPEGQVQQFLSKMKAGYYDFDPSRAARVETSLFATQPGGGAAVYLL